MSERIEKVNKLIKKELSKIIESELGIEFGMFSVVFVKTGSDLKNATVWISYFGNLTQEDAKKILDKNIYSFQQQLNSRIVLKYVPKIYFKFDHTAENAEKIEKIIEENRKTKSD